MVFCPYRANYFTVGLSKRVRNRRTNTSRDKFYFPTRRPFTENIARIITGRYYYSRSILSSVVRAEIIPIRLLFFSTRGRSAP